MKKYNQVLPAGCLLRELTKEDAEAFRSLRLRARDEEAEIFSETRQEEAALTAEDCFSQIEQGSDGFALGVFLNGELKGVACAYRDGTVKGRHKAFVWGVYLDEVLRGLGWGRMLMTALLDRIEKWPGLEQVVLEIIITEGTAAAYKLYLSLGFKFMCRIERALKDQDKYYSADRLVLDLR